MAQEYQATKLLVCRSWAQSAGASASWPSAAPGLLRLLPQSYVFQRNRTLSLQAELFRSLQRDSALPCARLRSPPPWSSPWQHARLLLDRNGAGQVVMWIAMPNFQSFLFRRCLCDTQLAAAQVLLALRAYQRERGGLPESLEALLPDYLVALPADGFDDEPLRYQRAQRMLHSAGLDGIDRGGERSADDEFEAEPTYPIRF